MAPRIFLYKYIIFSQLRIWLPGSAAGRLCEYRLIEPACSCSESVLIEPVAHFHFCSSKLGFTRGIDGLVAPSLAACDSLFEPPAAPVTLQCCSAAVGAVLFLLLGGCLSASSFSASRYSLASPEGLLFCLRLSASAPLPSTVPFPFPRPIPSLHRGHTF